MVFGRKSAEQRRQELDTAVRAAVAAMEALREDDPKRAKSELAGAPKVHFAEGGWQVELASSMIDLALGRRKQGFSRLIDVCRKLDDTSLARDDKNYLRLYALYRATEFAKDGKPPSELRDLVEDFRFDHTQVTPEIRERFPLKKVEDPVEAPPPPPPPPPGGDIEL